MDSSVTAVLLQSQGYEVIGVHMQMWDHEQENLAASRERCCALSDSNDARKVCEKLDIPFFAINAKEAFRDKVVDYLVHEYLQQRNPNPCVQCNNHIKFNYLFKKADELGCALVATGHYAQVRQDPVTGIARLLKAADPQKDQTYFLFGLSQAALRRTILPLGGFPKSMVRKLADQAALNMTQKPDNQEICFIGEGGYQDFVEKRSPASLRPRGIIRTVEGELLGEHDGLYRYTIGQRNGLRLGRKDIDDFFVIAMDPVNHVLLVGPEQYLFEKELIAEQVSWVHPVNELGVIRCKAKIGPQHEEAPCAVSVFENNTVRVEFEEAQRAITPGQAIVFYDGDEVLGGGFIYRAIRGNEQKS